MRYQYSYVHIICNYVLIVLQSSHLHLQIEVELLLKHAQYDSSASVYV